MKPSSREINTLKVMMYMFPRQFGLHNVFTSQVDRTKTAQKFQDYTLREEEIPRLFRRKPGAGSALPKIPKRLRGEAKRLVERLQVLHSRCSYLELLNYHCPITLECLRGPSHRQPTQLLPTQQKTTQGRLQRKRHRPTPASRALPEDQKRLRSVQSTQHLTTCHHESITELASPVSSVSAFCRATLQKIIPHDFLGHAESQHHNLDVLDRKIGHFLRLRRFETASLHELVQDFKVLVQTSTCS